LSAYKKLTSIDKIDGLINATTITIDALYDEVAKSGMPVALGFEQGIEAKDDNIVQLWPGSVPALVKLGEHIKDKGFKNVVVFVDNGSAAFQRFADGFKQGYGSPVQEIKVGADGTDLRSSALKASALKPDAIVFIIKPTSGALLVKELKSISSDSYQFVFDANMQTGFTDYQKVLKDTSILNGSILYTVPNIYRQEFTDNFKNKFGTEPTIGSETGYNAFMLLARSYDEDKVEWVENMQKASFNGADGKIVFDGNGIRIPELKIGTIENGKLPN
jgi:ABC-type branched-subunit amino acid transport system substrate-binding protein